MCDLHSRQLRILLRLRPNDCIATAVSNRRKLGGFRSACLGPATVSCSCESEVALGSQTSRRTRRDASASTGRCGSHARDGGAFALRKGVGVLRSTLQRWHLCRALLGADGVVSLGDRRHGCAGNGANGAPCGSQCGHRRRRLLVGGGHSSFFNGCSNCDSSSINFAVECVIASQSSFSSHCRGGPGGCLHTPMQAIFLRARTHMT
jgi:hypothetical protein